MSSKIQDKRITLAWTGASGAPYGLRLLECLLAADYQVYLLISSAARVVLATEHGLKLPAGPDAAKKTLIEHLDCDVSRLEVCGKEDWFSPPVASGSAAPKQMVVCPCSAGTLASVAHGMSDNLLERAADVVLKERGPATTGGARNTVFDTAPGKYAEAVKDGSDYHACGPPGFYHQPESIDDLIDFMVARILDHLGVEQGLVPRWGYDQRK